MPSNDLFIKNPSLQFLTSKKNRKNEEPAEFVTVTLYCVKSLVAKGCPSKYPLDDEKVMSLGNLGWIDHFPSSTVQLKIYFPEFTFVIRETFVAGCP